MKDTTTEKNTDTNSYKFSEMKVDGMSYRIVSVTPTADNPSVYLFNQTGSRSRHPDLTRPYHWVQTTVRRILSNQTYCGDTVNFKTYSKSNKLKKRLKKQSRKHINFQRHS